MRIRIHPAAEDDIREAVRYYRESFSEERSLEFLVEVYSAIEKIEESPLTWPVHRDTLRKFILRHFPYSLIYQVEKEIIILAVSHFRRDPDYWRTRLSD